MANTSYTYALQYGKTREGLIAAVENYLSSTENMETQLITDEAGYKVLQARAKGGKLKQFIGMDKAIMVRFVSKASNEIRMEIGESKWVDKGAVMAVSMFVLWPLAVTSGIGIYQQSKLPEKIKNAADEYIGIDNSSQKKEYINEATATKLSYAAQKIFRV
ncbi:MAG: hypothetical protein K2I96_04785 [Lachnospiraceae bacterium]|nr:hypothetical protein [Lachnospiraceae bacterium]